MKQAFNILVAVWLLQCWSPSGQKVFALRNNDGWIIRSENNWVDVKERNVVGGVVFAGNGFSCGQFKETN